MHAIIVVLRPLSFQIKHLALSRTHNLFNYNRVCLMVKQKQHMISGFQPQANERVGDCRPHNTV